MQAIEYVCNRLIAFNMGKIHVVWMNTIQSSKLAFTLKIGRNYRIQKEQRGDAPDSKKRKETRTLKQRAIHNSFSYK